jgi:hypothetical protein
MANQKDIELEHRPILTGRVRRSGPGRLSRCRTRGFGGKALARSGEAHPQIAVAARRMV